MSSRENRETVKQATTIALVIALLIPLSAWMLDFIVHKDIPTNLQGILTLYKINPMQWIILSSIVLFPLQTYLLSKFYMGKLTACEESLIKEQGRTMQINDFTKKLIDEDFTVDFQTEGEEDLLGNSLLKLRNTLKNNKEAAEKRQKEDEQRNWVAEGLAEFAGILRQNNDNIELLSYNVIKELTNYLGAIQGGFYLLEKDENGNRYFNLKSFFAYDRKKFADKKIKWADGLIGSAALEQKTIYLTKVPDNYVAVTSGLGQSNPRCILIVPLIYDEEIFGVIELASLNNLDAHKIKFTERVAESIASTLSSVHINIQTTQLLEESKSQAQALAAQEEEMRQNMEELQATQEEAARQTEKFILLDTTVNETMLRAEIDLEGKIVNCNEIFLKKFDFRNLAEVNKKVIQALIHESEANEFKSHWEDIAKKGEYYEDYICFNTTSGKELWVLATFNAMKHDDESYDRILLLALEAQEYRKLSLNHSGINNAVDATGIRAKININGNISEANQTFLDLIGYSTDELKTLTLFDLINSLELDSFNKNWEEITKGKNFIKTIKINTKSNKEIWINGSYYAVNDLNGDVDHVIFIGQDITNEKLLEIKTKEQQEALKEKDNLLNETEKEFVFKLRETRNELHSKIKELEKINSRDGQVLENTSDAVIITGHDNKIVLFNHAAENMLGYKKEEIINRDIGTLFSDEMIDSDDFIAKYVGPGDNKITGTRKQIKIRTNKGAVKTVLVLISKAVVEGENSYTAFFQEISK